MSEETTTEQVREFRTDISAEARLEICLVTSKMLKDRGQLIKHNSIEIPWRYQLGDDGWRAMVRIANESEFYYEVAYSNVMDQYVFMTYQVASVEILSMAKVVKEDDVDDEE